VREFAEQTVIEENTSWIQERRSNTLHGGVTMKRYKKYLLTGLCGIFTIALIFGVAFSGETKVITGTVNDDYEIVTDEGTAYTVEEGEIGDEVVELVGRKVKVTGTVEESEGEKMITVTSYVIIEE
jgi:hypothetical protein